MIGKEPKEFRFENCYRRIGFTKEMSYYCRTKKFAIPCN